MLLAINKNNLRLLIPMMNVTQVVLLCLLGLKWRCVKKTYAGRPHGKNAMLIKLGLQQLAISCCYSSVNIL